MGIIKIKRFSIRLTYAIKCTCWSSVPSCLWEVKRTGEWEETQNGRKVWTSSWRLTSVISFLHDALQTKCFGQVSSRTSDTCWKARDHVKLNACARSAVRLECTQSLNGVALAQFLDSTWGHSKAPYCCSAPPLGPEVSVAEDLRWLGWSTPGWGRPPALLWGLFGFLTESEELLPELLRQKVPPPLQEREEEEEVLGTYWA